MHRHHVIERSMGGKDTLGNILFVHSVCHRRIHYGGDAGLWRTHLISYKAAHPKLVKPRQRTSVKWPAQNDFREDFGFVNAPDKH